MLSSKKQQFMGLTGREMFDSWYSADSLIQSGGCNIKDVLTHGFSLDEIEKDILSAKKDNVER